jgi:hypothetical protein
MIEWCFGASRELGKGGGGNGQPARCSIGLGEQPDGSSEFEG